jgi:hypothetical protein
MTKTSDKVDRLAVQLQALEPDDWDILWSLARVARKRREYGGILLPSTEADRLQDFFSREAVRLAPRGDGIVWAQFPVNTRFLNCMHVTLPRGAEFVVIPRGAGDGPGGSGHEVFRLPRRTTKLSTSSKPSRKRRQKSKA